MKNIDLCELKIRLQGLAIFRGLLGDRVISALLDFLEKPTVTAYSEFASNLYETRALSLGEYVGDICENNENVYVKLVGCRQAVPDYIEVAVKEELKTLQAVADIKPQKLWNMIDWQGFLPSFGESDINISDSFFYRVKNIGKYGYGVYAKNRMFYVDENNAIIPVANPDETRFADLIDYEAERQIIIDNTKALLCGKPAANILLTGDAGTGKSSTVKAVANELFSEGLRIIEVRKEQLYAIPKILNELSENPLKFVLFIDDLSFLKDDDNFNALKAVLEGSVSAKSENVVIYATSNRRHIIKEKFSDRDGDDVHRNDTVQELISLSERFGIHITFQKPDKKTFLHIVHHLAKIHNIDMEDSELDLLAERFALERGGRSARLARQFIDGILSK